MQRTLIVLLFIAFANLLNAQQNFLDDAVNNGYCAGIAAGIMADGEISWQGNAGFADREAETAFFGETINRTASIAKPMTAVAVMQLAEQGKLDLDAPVGNYLPAFAAGDKAEVTVRHLMQHASGIRGYEKNKERQNYVNYPTLTDAMKVFMDSKLAFTPGTDYSYTTYGYVVLGVLIEVVSGKTYEAYLQENVWTPAGMTRTGLEKAGVDYPGKAALYHQLKPGKIKPAKATDLSDRVPGGGIQSTVDDLLRFGAAVLDGTLVTPESLAAMTADSGLKKEDNGYGMGWYLYGENEIVGALFGHNGEQLGCSSFLFLIPETNSVVAIVSNTSGAKREVGDILNHLFSVVVAQQRAKGGE
ncbi:serine hydrolase domain-containing protein [Neolewinella persica]|uniref:serine hydrolase domain-containing protein n=1 Tax=Neolewinella persica TaxID=70998 RepID=UPI0003AA9FE8|nr:serine hydrolase domain-containing protein [Neolewinella persica]